MSGKVNMQLLSRIVEYKYFIPLMDYAEVYFESAHEEGFLIRNSVIDLATADISGEEMCEQIRWLHKEAVN